METLVGQKRSREEALDAPVDEYAPQGKRTCEKLDSVVDESGTLALSSDSEEMPCLSSTGELYSKVVMSSDEDGTDSKVSMAETLRSLEEELGVSGDQSEFLMTGSAIEELSDSGLVSSWGDVIWSSDEGLASVNDVILSGEAGCTSESNPGRSDCLSSEYSSVLVEGDNSDTNVKTSSTSQKNEKYSPVDIGFLIEASDDELGIPPSPTSEKGQSSEQEQETFMSDNSVENSLNSAEVDTIGNLQDAVSWALEGGGDNMGFSDSGIDDWMMGNLDFMMDGQSAYSTVSPLVEAGLVL